MLDPNERTALDETGEVAYSEKCYDTVEEWKKGTLETLRMVGAGDFLAVKYVACFSILPQQLLKTTSQTHRGWSDRSGCHASTATNAGCFD